MVTSSTSRLTDLDRHAIAEARELAGLSGPGAVREYTGDPGSLTAYAVAFELAQQRMGGLLAIIERLGGGNG